MQRIHIVFPRKEFILGKKLNFLCGKQLSGQTFVMQSSNATKFKVWEPLNIFRCPPNYNHAVIVLNRPILLACNTVFSLWKKAKITVTVDGGTDRWMNYLGEERAERVLRGECKDFLPTLVTGDMDSITSDLLQRLENVNAKIVRTPDQNHTDYTKALMQLQLYATKKNVNLNSIYVLTESSGRFDHIIANINTLYKAENLINKNTEVIQVASNSLTWLLRPGTHKILIPDALIAQRSWCALIPFGSSTNQVKTTGLQWNLDKTCMSFGGLVSTSNTYNGNPEVTVSTNESIIWSMGIEPFTSCSIDSNAS